MRIADGIYTFDGILSREECDEYISWTEGLGYSDAPISTAAGFVLRPDIRNNARVIVDHTIERACCGRASKVPCLVFLGVDR